MTQSYPSSPVINIDIPEVKVFDAKFVYNFFTKDERINDSGEVPLELLEKPAESLGQSFIDKFSSRIPRFVKFSLSPVRILNSVEKIKENLSISDNVKSIHSEREFTNHSFTAIGFQDTGIDGKLFLLTSGSISKKINSNNERLKREIDGNVNSFIDKIDSNKISLADSVRFLNGNTNDSTSAEFIFNSLNDISRLGAQFVDSSEQDELINSRFQEIKNVDVKAKINNKIIAKALRTIKEDPLSLFSDEIKILMPTAESAEKQTIRDSEPDSIDDTEYDFVVDFISKRKISTDTFIPKARVLGYIIEKFEISDNGQVVNHNPIVIENENATTAIDFKIAYGTTYVYAIKTVAEIEFLVTDQETDDFYAAKVLVSSSPSPRQVVECTENVPPPPPADFNVGWDHKNRSARLTWSFPLNKQRDIKRFQVFRRSSIDEPFQLIKEYDFDDSDLKVQGPETPDINLVDVLSSPKMFYLDDELNVDGNSFIYAVCSIDAHGLSSNYSMQFEVKFDKFINNIKKKLISSSGSPKSYPNMFLNQDTFVDVMKDSGHTKLSIYFDPEYYAVTDKQTVVRRSKVGKERARDGRDLRLMATVQNGGSYKIQFINTDLQQSRTVDIIINDLTDVGNNKEDRMLGGVKRKIRKPNLNLSSGGPNSIVRSTGLKLGSGVSPSKVNNKARGLKLSSN